MYVRNVNQGFTLNVGAYLPPCQGFILEISAPPKKGPRKSHVFILGAPAMFKFNFFLLFAIVLPFLVRAATTEEDDHIRELLLGWNARPEICQKTRARLEEMGIFLNEDDTNCILQGTAGEEIVRFLNAHLNCFQNDVGEFHNNILNTLNSHPQQAHSVTVEANCAWEVFADLGDAILESIDAVIQANHDGSEDYIGLIQSGFLFGILKSNIEVLPVLIRHMTKGISEAEAEGKDQTGEKLGVEGRKFTLKAYRRFINSVRRPDLDADPSEHSGASDSTPPSTAA